MQFLKEWNEACAYAKECLPPCLYTLDWNLWNFMGFVSVTIGIVYLFNEWRINRRGF